MSEDYIQDFLKRIAAEVPDDSATLRDARELAGDPPTTAEEAREALRKFSALSVVMLCKKGEDLAEISSGSYAAFKEFEVNYAREVTQGSLVDPYERAGVSDVANEVIAAIRWAWPIPYMAIAPTLFNDELSAEDRIEVLKAVINDLAPWDQVGRHIEDEWLYKARIKARGVHERAEIDVSEKAEAAMDAIVQALADGGYEAVVTADGQLAIKLREGAGPQLSEEQIKAHTQKIMEIMQEAVRPLGAFLADFGGEFFEINAETDEVIRRGTYEAQETGEWTPLDDAALRRHLGE